MGPTRIGENEQSISGKTTGAHHHQQHWPPKASNILLTLKASYSGFRVLFFLSIYLSVRVRRFLADCFVVAASSSFFYKDSETRPSTESSKHSSYPKKPLFRVQDFFLSFCLGGSSWRIALGFAAFLLLPARILIPIRWISTYLEYDDLGFLFRARAERERWVFWMPSSFVVVKDREMDMTFQRDFPRICWVVHWSNLPRVELQWQLETLFVHIVCLLVYLFRFVVLVVVLFCEELWWAVEDKSCGEENLRVECF